MNRAQPRNRKSIFTSVANIRQSLKADRVSPLRWPPFKTNYRAESWVTATGVLEHESKSALKTICDTVCVHLSLFVYLSRLESRLLCHCYFSNRYYANQSFWCIDWWSQHAMKILYLYSLHNHEHTSFYASFKIQHPATDCMITKTSMAVCMCPWIIYICVANCVCECTCLRRLISTQCQLVSHSPIL